MSSATFYIIQTLNLNHYNYKQKHVQVQHRFFCFFNERINLLTFFVNENEKATFHYYSVYIKV